MSTMARPPDSVNNTTLELQQDLARSTPRQCVTLTHSVPSVQMYYALKTKIDNCTEKWLQEFLELNGLDSLLDSLDQLTGRGFTSFSDAILQLDCIACIRAILNSNQGLEFFINSDIYTKKLTMALNSHDTLPKKQVFEVLSAVCAYSHIGYLRVLEGLSYVKSECDQLHRFSIIVSDLQRSETLANKTAILTFINAIINCTPDVTERVRMRNEFVGLNLLDVLTYMRREEPDEDLLLQLEVFHERKLADEEAVNAESNIDFNSPQDLLDQIQSRVFGTPRMVNFVNILQDMLAVETVHAENSLKIWQALDGLIHHVVHTLDAVALDNVQSELQKLPDQLHQALQCLHSYKCGQVGPTQGFKPEPSECCIKRQSSEFQKNVNQNESSREGSPWPYCSAYSGGFSSTEKDGNDTVINCAEQKESNSRLSTSNSEHVYQQENNDSLSSNQSSQLSNGENENRPVDKEEKFVNQSAQLATNHSKASKECMSSQTIQSGPMAQLDYGLPKDKMYENNLNKSDCQQEKRSFDHSKVLGNFDCVDSGSTGCQGTVKTLTSKESRTKLRNPFRERKFVNVSLNLKSVNESCSDNNESFLPVVQHTVKITRPTVPSPMKPVYNLKWITLNDQRIAVNDQCVWMSPLSEQIQPDYRGFESMFTSGEKSLVVEEVILLSANTRLNINLFLSRLDSGAEDLVQSLEEGDAQDLSLPMLQYLHKILPCQEEISMLRQYKGSRLELGMAEQFVLLLSDIPDYIVLLEGHLMRVEFETGVKEFNSSLNLMIDIAKVILKNSHLKQLLHLILCVGNFLNHGLFNGDAAGFKLTTLERLQEVKSKLPSKTLLHHLVQAVSDVDDKLLTVLVRDLLPLEKASSCSVEEMKGNISGLNAKLRSFIKKLTSAGTMVQTKFEPFIESLKKEYAEIQSKTTELRTLSDQLADYFCEEGATFNIHECFKCLLTFCKEIKKCQSDNFVLTRQQQLAKKKGDALHKRLKTKLLSLEFGENAGASSSMLEDKHKMVEKMLDQLHRGSFHPFIKTDPTILDNDLHPLEMSCIPFEGSPGPLRGRLGAALNDSVFPETPELAGVPRPRVPSMSRCSTQRLKPLTATCTAQMSGHPNTVSDSSMVGEVRTSTLTKRGSLPSNKSKVPLDLDASDNGLDGNPQKKLFQTVIKANSRAKHTESSGPLEKPKHRHLEVPQRKGGHRRSRSDLSESVCIINKWIKYEEIRNMEERDQNTAPLAKQESLLNISTLHLENKGKFLTDQELQRFNPSSNVYQDIVCNLPQGPTIKLPEMKDKKLEKKSSVGGFLSKLGRAVLRPRNVYSDGDQFDGFKRSESVRRSKKFFVSAQEKENVEFDQMTPEERMALKEDKKGKSDQSKVSRFFQRGGLYRSSKMKGKAKKESI